MSTQKKLEAKGMEDLVLVILQILRCPITVLSQSHNKVVDGLQHPFGFVVQIVVTQIQFCELSEFLESPNVHTWNDQSEKFVGCVANRHRNVQSANL